MMFLQAPADPGVAVPTFDALFKAFSAHPIIGIITVICFLLLVIGVFRFSDILNYFNKRAEKKEELELKRLDVDEKRYEGLKETVKEVKETVKEVKDVVEKVVDNNTQALQSVERALILTKSDIVKELSDVKLDLLEKISSTAREAASQAKIDRIAARQGGGEEDCRHGDRS